MKLEYHSIHELANLLKEKGHVTQQSFNGNFMIRTAEPVYGFKQARKDKNGFSWGEANHAICNLIIPSNTLVHFAADESGKCRAEQVFVHSIFSKKGKRKELKKAFAFHDRDFVYRKHDLVKPLEKFSTSLDACQSGIHFFLDLKSAYEY